MPWTRASSLERSLHCAASTVLPTVELRSPSTMEAADWGTMAHSWAATGRIVPVMPKHGPLFEKKLKACWETLEGAEEARLRLWPGGEHELSVAYNCDTGAFCSERVAQEALDAWRSQYGKEWITGTLDYLDSLLGDPWVDDLKTGKVPPPPDSEQVVFYGLLGWLIDGATADRIVTSITHWPRYPVLCYPHRAEVEVTAKELDEFQRRLRMSYIQHGKAAAGDIRYRTGDHCTWCPSRTGCSAFLEVNEYGDDPE